jgi:hypothetical protein
MYHKSYFQITHCKFLCCILCLSTNKNHHSSRYFWIIRFPFEFGPFQWISWGSFLIYFVWPIWPEVNFPYFHTRENNRLLDYYKIISISGQYGGLGMIRYFWIIRFPFEFGPFQWISWGRFLIYWRYNSVSVGKLCNGFNNNNAIIILFCHLRNNNNNNNNNNKSHI